MWKSLGDGSTYVSLCPLCVSRMIKRPAVEQPSVSTVSVELKVSRLSNKRSLFSWPLPLFVQRNPFESSATLRVDQTNKTAWRIVAPSQSPLIALENEKVRLHLWITSYFSCKCKIKRERRAALAGLRKRKRKRRCCWVSVVDVFVEERSLYLLLSSQTNWNDPSFLMALFWGGGLNINNLLVRFEKSLQDTITPKEKISSRRSKICSNSIWV